MSYLVYNKFDDEDPDEYGYHTYLEKETCDQYNEEFNQGNNQNGCPVHVDADMVENWYPKTFAEKIDRMLLYFSECVSHIGQAVRFPVNELLGVLFVDRWEKNFKVSSNSPRNWKERYSSEYDAELYFISDYLKRVLISITVVFILILRSR